MTTAEAPDGVLEWEVRLWESAPQKRYALVAVSLAVAVFSAVAFNHLLLGILAFVFLMGSTMEFWYPVKFRLDPASASARVGVSLTSVKWSEVKRVVEGENGVKLSPLEKAGRTAPFRGVYIRFKNNRDDVLAFIRASIDRDAEFLGRGTDGRADDSDAR